MFGHPCVGWRLPNFQRLVDLLKRFRTEQPSSVAHGAPLANGVIDSMVVIDRQVDMVSALCTQLTYEGLVDEVVGIKHCAESLPAQDQVKRTITAADYWHLVRSPHRCRSGSLESATACFDLDAYAGFDEFADAAEAKTSPLVVDRPAVCRLAGSKLCRRRERAESYGEAAERRLREAPSGKDGGGAAPVCRPAWRTAVRASSSATTCVEPACAAILILQLNDGAPADTNLTEQVMNLTRTDAFNIALEVQQSQFPRSTR
jgi:hypothetical protein